MNEILNFRFVSQVPPARLEELLALAVMATEGLHGMAGTRIEAGFTLDEAGRAIVIDATTQVGRDLARIFVNYVNEEFGEESYEIKRCGRLTQIGHVHSSN